MNPRVDTEGDGELRTQRDLLGQKLGALLVALGVANDVPLTGPQLLNAADDASAIVARFGDVERELAQLREAAEDALGAWDNTTDDYWALGPFMDALRDVLASASQSEDPKQ